MKVVLDTNVLVSGLMTRGGTCALILDLLSDNRVTAVLDGRILAEYRRVCAEPRLRLDAEAVRDFLHYLDDFAENIAAMPLKADLPDPDDLPFLEVAAEAHAVLVTGNKKHFPEEIVGAVRIVSPQEFVDMLRVSSGSLAQRRDWMRSSSGVGCDEGIGFRPRTPNGRGVPHDLPCSQTVRAVSDGICHNLNRFPA